MTVRAELLSLPDARSTSQPAVAAVAPRLWSARTSGIARWIAIDVAVWAGVALLFTVQAATRGVTPVPQLLASTLVSFVPCALFTPAIAWVSLHYRPDEAGPGRALLAHALMLLTFLTVGSVMMGGLEWSLPWAEREGGLALAMRHATTRYFAIDAILYASIAGACLTWAYAREARERSVRAARLQTQLAQARLHALGAQLQPHFLFNTLHVISALVRADPRRAEQLIARLSDLLREMLDNGEREEVPLQEELRFLEKYADIQEARFGPRLRVAFEVGPEVLGAAVPRLVLQPLVENAVRHGLASRASAGTVLVRAACADGRLTLIVEDDGVGLPAEGPGREGVGLATTRARLAQLYGNDASFTIRPAPTRGTRCTIEMPCRLATLSAGEGS